MSKARSHSRKLDYLEVERIKINKEPRDVLSTQVGAAEGKVPNETGSTNLQKPKVVRGASGTSNGKNLKASTVLKTPVKPEDSSKKIPLSKRMRGWLLELDFLAPPLNLNVGGASGLRSMFGVFLSIVYTGTIALLGYFIVLQYFDTTNPQVAQDASEAGYYPRISFVDNKFFPVLYVFLNDVINIPVDSIPKYFTVRYYKYNITMKMDNSTGKTSITSDLKTMDVVPCRDIMKDPVYFKYYEPYQDTEFFKLYGEKFGLCIKVNESLSSIQGGGADPNTEILSYKIMPCSLSNTSKCASLDDMRKVGFIFSMPSASMNLSNYENPMSSYLNADNFYYINEGLKQKFQSKMFQTEIFDDPGMYFPTRHRTNFSAVDRLITSSRTRDPTQLTCTDAEVLSTACNAYVNFDFMSSGRKITITRSYKGVVEVIGDLGGVNSVVFLFFLYANLVYVTTMQKKWLVNTIFDFFRDDLFQVKSASGHKKSGGVGRCLSWVFCCRLCCKKKDKPKSTTLDDSEDGKKPQDINLKLDKETVKSLQDEAFQVIEKTLDVITLVREINNLKVLTHMLLRDYHHKLVPLISLSLQCSKSKASKPSKTVQKNEPEPEPKIETEEDQGFFEEYIEFDLDEGPKMSFQEALMLMKYHRSRAKETPPQVRTIDQNVEIFCFEALDRGDKVFKTLANDMDKDLFNGVIKAAEVALREKFPDGPEDLHKLQRHRSKLDVERFSVTGDPEPLVFGRRYSSKVYGQAIFATQARELLKTVNAYQNKDEATSHEMPSVADEKKELNLSMRMPMAMKRPFVGDSPASDLKDVFSLIDQSPPSHR